MANAYVQNLPALTDPLYVVDEQTSAEQVHNTVKTRLQYEDYFWEIPIYLHNVYVEHPNLLSEILAHLNSQGEDWDFWDLFHPMTNVNLRPFFRFLVFVERLEREVREGRLTSRLEELEDAFVEHVDWRPFLRRESRARRDTWGVPLNSEGRPVLWDSWEFIEKLERIRDDSAERRLYIPPADNQTLLERWQTNIIEPSRNHSNYIQSLVPELAMGMFMGQTQWTIPREIPHPRPHYPPTAPVLDRIIAQYPWATNLGLDASIADERQRYRARIDELRRQFTTSTPGSYRPHIDRETDPVGHLNVLRQIEAMLETELRVINHRRITSLLEDIVDDVFWHITRHPLPTQSDSIRNIIGPYIYRDTPNRLPILDILTSLRNPRIRFLVNRALQDAWPREWSPRLNPPYAHQAHPQGDIPIQGPLMRFSPPSTGQRWIMSLLRSYLPLFQNTTFPYPPYKPNFGLVNRLARDKHTGKLQLRNDDRPVTSKIYDDMERNLDGFVKLNRDALPFRLAGWATSINPFNQSIYNITRHWRLQAPNQLFPPSFLIPRTVLAEHGIDPDRDPSNMYAWPESFIRELDLLANRTQGQGDYVIALLADRLEQRAHWTPAEMRHYRPSKLHEDDGFAYTEQGETVVWLDRFDVKFVRRQFDSKVLGRHSAAMQRHKDAHRNRLTVAAGVGDRIASQIARGVTPFSSDDDDDDSSDDDGDDDAANRYGEWYFQLGHPTYELYGAYRGPPLSEAPDEPEPVEEQDVLRRTGWYLRTFDDVGNSVWYGFAGDVPPEVHDPDDDPDGEPADQVEFDEDGYVRVRFDSDEEEEEGEDEGEQEEEDQVEEEEEGEDQEGAGVVGEDEDEDGASEDAEPDDGENEDTESKDPNDPTSYNRRASTPFTAPLDRYALRDREKQGIHITIPSPLSPDLEALLGERKHWRTHGKGRRKMDWGLKTFKPPHFSHGKRRREGERDDDWIPSEEYGARKKRRVRKTSTSHPDLAFLSEGEVSRASGDDDGVVPGGVTKLQGAKKAAKKRKRVVSDHDKAYLPGLYDDTFSSDEFLSSEGVSEDQGEVRPGGVSKTTQRGRKRQRVRGRDGAYLPGEELSSDGYRGKKKGKTRSKLLGNDLDITPSQDISDNMDVVTPSSARKFPSPPSRKRRRTSVGNDPYKPNLQNPEPSSSSDETPTPRTPKLKHVHFHTPSPDPNISSLPTSLAPRKKRRFWTPPPPSPTLSSSSSSPISYSSSSSSSTSSDTAEPVPAPLTPSHPVPKTTTQRWWWPWNPPPPPTVSPSPSPSSPSPSPSPTSSPQRTPHTPHTPSTPPPTSLHPQTPPGPRNRRRFHSPSPPSSPTTMLRRTQRKLVAATTLGFLDSQQQTEEAEPGGREEGGSMVVEVDAAEAKRGKGKLGPSPLAVSVTYDDEEEEFFEEDSLSQVSTNSAVASETLEPATETRISFLATVIDKVKAYFFPAPPPAPQSTSSVSDEDEEEDSLGWDDTERRYDAEHNASKRPRFNLPPAFSSVLPTIVEEEEEPEKEEKVLVLRVGRKVRLVAG